MKDLVNYCKKNNCRLEFVFDGSFIHLLIFKNNEDKSLCHLEADSNLYDKLIRAVKTQTKFWRLKNENKEKIVDEKPRYCGDCCFCRQYYDDIHEELFYQCLVFDKKIDDCEERPTVKSCNMLRSKANER